MELDVLNALNLIINAQYCKWHVNNNSGATEIECNFISDCFNNNALSPNTLLSTIQTCFNVKINRHSFKSPQKLATGKNNYNIFNYLYDV